MNSNQTRRRLLAAGAAAAAGSLAPLRAFAQGNYPNRPIRFIVPFPPGISPDVVARLLADKLSQGLGQPVVVDNRAGAAGIIGAEAAAKAAPDGYTLFMSVLSIMGFNPHVYAKLPYDPLRDFTPVSEVAVIPHALLASPAVSAKNLTELLALARANPGALDFASPGVGSGPHLMMEMLAGEARVRLNHVPFKTTGLSEVMAGQVAISFEPITTALPQIKAGKVRALAISEPRRIAQLPEVPAVAETLPGFAIDSWQGIFMPAQTPAEIVTRMNTELVKAMRSLEVQRKFDELGFRTIASKPEEFRAALARDYEQWGRMIRKLGIKAEF